MLTEIRNIIEAARHQVQRAVNAAMVSAYWQIGHLIIEQEQEGEQRAAYGKQLLKGLSEKLTAEFGKSFDISNLRNMRRFYQIFPIRETVSLELGWSHYRRLMAVDKRRIDNVEALDIPPGHVLSSGCGRVRFHWPYGRGFNLVLWFADKRSR